MKTMLLAVSGMSPAIITETLYGINKRGDAWPKSIKIITTSIGAEKKGSSSQRVDFRPSLMNTISTLR